MGISHDAVHHPAHYNQYSIEVIEVTRHCSFNIGNAIKYILRHLDKGKPVEDLGKAYWYLNDQARNFLALTIVPDEVKGKLETLAEEYSNREGAVIDAVATLIYLKDDELGKAKGSLGRFLDQSFT